MIIFSLAVLSFVDLVVGVSHCYHESGLPQFCEPEFSNPAFERPVHATNTCGAKGPTEYCLQTDITVRQFQNDFTRCEVCDNANPLFAHPAKYLTDYNSDAKNEETYWQSETMYENIQHPNSVNLTMDFGKAIEITYIRLIFHSSMPESMQILKKTHADSDWTPYEYYSANCQEMYGLDPRERIVRDNQAICVKEYSDIVPLTGGTLAFVSLRDRPSAYSFFESETLQEWVTAVAIRIVLNRLNTYGDEVFGDPKVLKSYYYAISDIAVGGKCKCHGHANSCPKDVDGELYCQCQHNTAGRDCEKCKPFYQDVPFQPAKQNQPFECRACECHGHTDTCEFDAAAYARTGRGGRCTNCQNNTQGFHCDTCKPGYYRPPGSNSRDACLPCNCDPTGAMESQCDNDGMCKCFPGVASPKCDRCLPEYYNLTAGVGCTPCNCHSAGSQSAICHPGTGNCHCKFNVDGRTCDKCRKGFFNIDRSNPQGCQPCYCFGHGATCQSHDSYSPSSIISRFSSSVDGWKAIDDAGVKHALSTKDGRLEIRSSTTSSDAPLETTLKLIAPKKFLGDQRNSFMRFLNFTLEIYGGPPPVSQQDDIVVEGGSWTQPSLSLSWPIHTFNDSIWTYLNHQQGYQANRPLRLAVSMRFLPSIDPQSNDRSVFAVLSNVTRLAIRPVYLTPFRVAYLDDVTLETAVLNTEGTGGDAPWVEKCECAEGYTGDFCQFCAQGFRRTTRFGGSVTNCEPCQCYNHSSTCDAESGKCDCSYNTVGDNCDLCEPGYYGDATVGTPNDCKRCPCPEVVPGQVGTCSLMLLSTSADSSVPVCHKCPVGKTGRLCEMCQPGFYSNYNDLGHLECLPCQCSGNADPNAILSCDRTTGNCANCRYDTTGIHCDRCLDGFYGDATAPTAPKCHPCNCNPKGSTTLNCRNPNGECNCLPNVVGRQCDRCGTGFFNMTQPNGCEPCNCNLRGAKTAACDQETGVCQCQANAAPPRCDHCLPQHYGFSSKGCKPCDCDLIGAESMDCDVATGQCICRVGMDVIVGRRCDRCANNHYDLPNGCPECPTCYRQVRDSIGKFSVIVEQLRRRLEAIAAGIIGGAAGLSDDKNFTASIEELQQLAQSVAVEAGRIREVMDQATGYYDSLKRKFDKLHEDFLEETRRLNQTEEMLAQWVSPGGPSDQLKAINETLSARLQMASITLEESKALLRDLKLAATGDLATGESGYGLLAQYAHQARQYRSDIKEERLKIEALAANNSEVFQKTHDAVKEMSRALPEDIGSQTISARDTLDELKMRLQFSSKRVVDFFSSETNSEGDAVTLVTEASANFRDASTKLNTEAKLLNIPPKAKLDIPINPYDPRDRIEGKN